MKKWFVSDFETTSERYYKKYGYTRVWLWSICDMEANIVKDGTDIESFFSTIRKMRCATIYFHNLKFDGSFIIDYALKLGFKFYDTLSKDIDKGISTVIDDMGAYYCIDIRFNKTNTIHFRDSLKLLPFKVAKIAKDFNLPILKEEIDYDKYEVNDKTLEYIHHDVKIVAMALKVVKEEGLTKLTTASSAYAMYTNTSKYNESLDVILPDLPVDFLTEWRQAYRGGRSQVNPLHQGKVLSNVKRFDINSMYPYIMHDMELPYGMPKYLKTKEDMGKYKFELYHIRIEFMANPKCLPSLLCKMNFSDIDSTYYTCSNGIIELWISNIDLDLVKRNYIVLSIEFIEGWGFHTTTLLFKDYVDYWYDRKNKDKGAKRIVDKLMLNSLYGKFGSNVMRAHKIPRIEDEVVVFSNSEMEESKHYYLPLAIAITSWGHKLNDDAIHLTGVKNFVYCDTDSIHTLGTLPKDMIDNHLLGKFKLEAIEDKCKYVRQKCYCTYENGDYHITCAGMTDNLKEKFIRNNKDIFGSFDMGLELSGKLLPMRVKGGTILRETTFKIQY